MLGNATVFFRRFLQIEDSLPQMLQKARRLGPSMKILCTASSGVILVMFCSHERNLTRADVITNNIGVYRKPQRIKWFVLYTPQMRKISIYLRRYLTQVQANNPASNFNDLTKNVLDPKKGSIISLAKDLD